MNDLNTKYKNQPKFLYSMMFVLRDLVFGAFTIWITYQLQNHNNPDDNITQLLLYPLYSTVMGTIMTGVWVLGHECGHGAFGDNWIQNDIVGFFLHSFLLVPYFSWKNSHNKHHKYTNHLLLGDSHVPPLRPTFPTLRKFVGEDAFAFFDIFTRLTFGWLMYLFFNSSGGRTQTDCKTKIQPNINKSHFLSSSQVMKPSWKIEFSTLGCLTTI
jgi:omega-6 fatty acid desaturase (delta-12 desaturase)